MRWCRVLIFTFLTFVSVSAVAQDGFQLVTDIQKYRLSAPLAGIDIGQGVNPLALVFTVGVRPKCVDGSQTASFDNLEGSSISGYFASFKTQQSLVESINTAFSVTGEMANVSVAASSEVLKQVEFNYNHAYAYLYVKREFLPRNLKDGSLQREITNIQSFFTDCGSEFLNSYIPGAYAIGIVDCATRTTKEKDTATNELGKLEGAVPIGTGSAKFGGSLKSVVDRISELTSSECHLKFDAAGGKGEISLATDQFLPSMASYVQNGDAKTATVLRLFTAPYINLAKNDHERAVLRSLEDMIKGPKQTIENAKERIDLRIDYVEELEELMSTSLGRELNDFRRLVEQRNSVRQQIRALEDMISRCASDPFRVWRPRCGQTEEN